MPEFKSIAQHTVKEGETLSHLALKYYGSTEKAKWMLIYEANKALIGNNPAVIRPGLVLNIPDEQQSTASQPDTGPKMGKGERHIEE
jgi:nucleoid-associated protein YgaU